MPYAQCVKPHPRPLLQSPFLVEGFLLPKAQCSALSLFLMNCYKPPARHRLRHQARRASSNRNYRMAHGARHKVNSKFEIENLTSDLLCLSLFPMPHALCSMPSQIRNPQSLLAPCSMPHLHPASCIMHPETQIRNPLFTLCSMPHALCQPTVAPQE